MSKFHSYKVDRSDAEQVKDCHLQRLHGYGRCTIGLHTRVLGSLLTFIESKGQHHSRYLTFSESNLFQWMIDNAKGKKPRYFESHLSVVNQYMERLCVHGVLIDNPLRQIKPLSMRPAWRSIVDALQSSNPIQELEALRAAPPERGPLYFFIEKYISLQQSLGKKYDTHYKILCDFDSFIAAQKINTPKAVKSEHILHWLAQMQCNKTVRKSKASLVKRYFDYLTGLGIRSCNPASVVVTELGRAPQRKHQPFIFSKAQILTILKYSKQLPPSHIFKLRPQVCYMMLALVYALGLRSGEVRKLQFHNIDMERRTLRIEGTKFYKSRIIPFGPKIHRCLKEYMAERQRIFAPIRPNDPLFITSRRREIGRTTLNNVFHLLTKPLEPRPSSPPRLYDLRHTFAVHRLLRWYQEGVDVQSKLTLLSTFMGHTRICSTEVYLTITMDLLKEANKRFHQNCGILIGKVITHEE